VSGDLLDLGLLGRMLALVGRVALWLIESLALGVRTLIRIGGALARSQQVFSKTLRCPRGHASHTYGVWRCARCRAAIEGWAFGACSICGHRATWIACPRCQLAIRGPWR